MPGRPSSSARRRLLVLGAVALALLAFRGERGDDPPFAPFVQQDFPFFGSTLDASGLGGSHPARNVAIRGLVLPLGDSVYACFDPDLLRMAVGWHGDFMTLEAMAQVSYQQAGNKANGVPKVLGRPIAATGVYPGWHAGEPRFEDPRPPGPNPEEVGRGPIPAEMGRWEGVYVAADHAVLAYEVGGTRILEQPAAVRAGGEAGLARAFRIGRTAGPLTLVVGEAADGVSARASGPWIEVTHAGGRLTRVGASGLPEGAALRVRENRYLTLHLPAGMPASEFAVVSWHGDPAGAAQFERMLGRRFRVAEVERGGPARWPEAVPTRGQPAPDTAAFVLDEIALPMPNPWRRNVRPAGLDFFPDGRAAVVTFDGDVWIASGLTPGLERVEWRRFASGLYEPLSVQVVDGRVYVFGRDGITRFHDLNDDGEADFYENFSNLIVESIESREYPMDLVARPGGGFFAAKGAALDNGPKTSPRLMPGFRAGGGHAGSVLEVSADGRQVRRYASGLREPFIGLNEETGVLTASDQQGNFVPSTPVYVIRENGYYGVPATAHRADPPEPEPPLTWIPHQVDQSGASQLWVTGGRMGPLDGALVHLSYGEPAAFRVYFDSTAAGLQGGIVRIPGDYPAPTMKGAVHPGDGQLYLIGFQIWGSKARQTGGLVRLRYTGLPSPLPSAVRAGAEGVLLRFDRTLDPAAAARFEVRRWNYRRTERYGSGRYRMDGSEGFETLPVAGAHLSADGRTVLLHLPGMRVVDQMEVAYRLRGRDGGEFSNAVYLTVNHLSGLPLAEYGLEGAELAGDAAAAAPEPAPPPVAATAALGEALYQRMGCIGCHSIDGTLEGKSGPSLKGAFGRMRRFTDGTAQMGDEAYLLRSILEPAAQIVEGYQEGMPTYRGVLSEPEVESLVRFIRGL